MPEPNLDYDQKQKAAVRLECAICHALVYATKPFEPYVCLRCRGEQKNVSRVEVKCAAPSTGSSREP
jgi:hypothetical protein